MAIAVPDVGRRAFGDNRQRYSDLVANVCFGSEADIGRVAADCAASELDDQRRDVHGMIRLKPSRRFQTAASGLPPTPPQSCQERHRTLTAIWFQIR